MFTAQPHQDPVNLLNMKVEWYLVLNNFDSCISDVYATTVT